MEDHVAQIKERLDIVDVVSSYIKTQKAGVNFKARCPFHNEKTPSFNISPERQIWHCFGCSKGGDMFSFVQEIEGVDFPESLRILAARAGVQLKQFDPQLSNAKNRLYEIVELAAKFFEKQLHQSSTGKSALAYLTDRGLVDTTIKEFRLGFAPNDWHALGEFLQNCGYSQKEISDSGMAIGRDGKFYDRFRSRITFPIMDVNGQVVGFTGRVFEQKTEGSGQQAVEVAKYINTPQTLIYDKSRVLYGLAKSKTDVKQADRCLLVEGNMDALMSFQAGARNVVATSGTALTMEHLKILKRYTSKLDFCFDTDQAGVQATRRGIALALSQDCKVNIVRIDDPACKDPADYVVRHGAKWAEIASQAVPVIQFYFDKARQNYDPHSAESKRLVIAAVGPLINHVASSVERAHWIGQLAVLLRVPEAAVAADVAAVKDDLRVQEYGMHGKATPISPTVVSVAKADLPLDVLSEALLSIFLRQPQRFAGQLAAVPLETLDPSIAGVFNQIATHASGASSPITLDGIITALGTDYARQLEFAYLRSQELWNEFTDDQLELEFKAILSKIQQKSIHARLANLTFDIRQAEQDKDIPRLGTLAGEFTGLVTRLAQLQKV